MLALHSVQNGITKHLYRFIINNWKQYLISQTQIENSKWHAFFLIISLYFCQIDWETVYLIQDWFENICGKNNNNNTTTTTKILFSLT